MSDFFNSRKVNFLTDQVDRLNRKFLEKGAGSAALQDYDRAVATGVKTVGVLAQPMMLGLR